MYVKDYKRIRTFAKKSRVVLKVEKKCGLPFFIKKYKLRVGVLVGILLFALVVMFMSCFVWTIDIVGLETISEAKLLSVLEDNGLYVGMFKKNASFKMIERKTMLDIDDIGWMSINVTNSHASVELKEKAKSPKVPDYKKPANVKAKRDGLILKINTSEGVSYFESGSAVVKDQLIVSSVVEDMQGGLKLVRANSQIIARTSRNKTFTIQKECQVKTFFEPNYRRNISVFALDFPVFLTFADEKKSLSNFKIESIQLFDTILPVSLISESVYGFENEIKAFSEEDARNVLLKYCSLYQCFELSECIIKDRKYSFYETESAYCLDANFICEEDIAYQQEINIDNADLTQILPDKKDTESNN